MTTTTVSEWAFHNYGPLTTTYTAPGSCFTGSPTNVQLGSSFLDHETNSTSVAIIAGTCASTTATTTTDWKPFGDCLPSGSDMDKNYAAVDTNNPLAGVTIDYFSPGLYCPSGYTTAGIASKGDGGTITSSGPAFVPSTALLTQSGGRGLAPYYNIAPQVLLQEIHEGETAILCARR